MNTKNRLIKKLLGVAKKHKFLTYPVLALVAIISVISNLFSWSTGAGRRVVAVIMVMVMLVSQSYFLTSSATEAIDDEETALVQQELQQEVMNEYVEAESNDKKESETSTEVADNSSSDDIIEEETINNVTGDQPTDQQAAQTIKQSNEQDNSDANVAVVNGDDLNAPPSENSETLENDSVDNYGDIEDDEVDSKLDTEDEANKIPVTFMYQTPGGNDFKAMTGDGAVGVYAVTADNGDGKKKVTKYVDSDGKDVNIVNIFNNLDDRDGSYTVSGCYDFYGVEQTDNTWCRDSECNTLVSDGMAISGTAKSLTLYAQSKLVRVYMTLSDSFDNGKSYNSNPTINTDDVKVVGDETRYYFNLVDNKAEVSITNAEVYGYELSDVLLGSGSIATVINSTTNTDTAYHKIFSFDLTLRSDSYTNKVTLKWTPMQYKVVYAAYDQADYLAHPENYVSFIGKASDPIKYDDTARFANYKSLFDNKLRVGYDLLGWELKGDGGVYAAGSSIPTDNQDDFLNYYYANKDNIDGDTPGLNHAMIFPYYEPAEIDMRVTDADGSDVSLENKTITYVYDMPGAEYRFTARFKYKDTTRESDIGDFTYTATANGANNIGVTVKDVNGDGNRYSSVSTVKPTGVSDGEQSIPLSIVVKNNDTNKTKTFSDYSISVRRKRIKITSSDISVAQKRKTYNGNQNVDTTDTKFPETFNTVSDEIGDTSASDIKISYDSAQFAQADAGTNIDIILNNPHKSGTNSDCYDLVGMESDADGNSIYTISGGIIKQRDLKVNTVYKGSNLTAGEDDPTQDKYTLSLYDGEDFEGVDGINTIDDAIENNALGTYSFSLIGRTEKNKEGEYKVDANFVNDGNFYVTVRDRDVVKVVQKAPVENENYRIVGNLNGEWYYTDNAPTISPITTSGYDRIIVSKESFNDAQLSAETGVETYTVSEADSEQSLNIWLKNSKTKAITSKATISLKYDGTNPQYKNYEVKEFNKDGTSYSSVDGSGLYFPNVGSVLDFGTYSNNTIRISINYTDISENTDITSGLDKLYYRLYSDTTLNFESFAPTSQNVASSDFVESNGNWVADIELPKDAAKKGAIDIIAYDKAGNNCGGMRLRPDGRGEDYEWLVEDLLSVSDMPTVYYSNDSDNRVLYTRDSNTGDYSKTSDSAKRSIYIVTDDNGISERTYYNHCQASIEVSDSGSGIKRIEWYDNGSLVKVDDQSWNITDESLVDEDKREKKVNTSKVTSTYDVVEQGTHKIKVLVYDNAGNSNADDAREIVFSTDDVDPVVEVTNKNENGWTNSSIITFTAYDPGDNASGIATVKVINSSGNLLDCDNLKNVGDGSYTGSFDIKNYPDGFYGLEAVDNAGNVYRIGGKVDNYSNTAPAHPAVTFTPADDNYYTWVDYPEGTDTLKWHRTATKVTISYPGEELNGSPVVDSKCPVSVYYNIYKDVAGKAYHDSSFNNKMSDEVTISDDGIFYVDAWAESASSVRCDGKTNSSHVDSVNSGAYEVLMIDKTAPSFEKFTTTKADNGIIISYDIIDNVSGVDEASIELYYNDEIDNKTDVKTEPIDNGYRVSFNIARIGEYKLSVKDIAGNTVSTSIVPMSMKVKSVTNITDTSALVGANIYSGTFDIKSGTISYKKYSEDEYKEAESVLVPYPNSDSRDRAVSANLSDLTPDTAYTFKVVATSDNGEVLEYIGSFKTLATDQKGTTVPGTAYYSDNIEPANRGPITVGIYDGNMCMMAQEINDGDEFVFEAVPDGNYNIIASDGKYSKTVRLSVDDGMITYPDGLIEIELSGINTSVELEDDDTPKITVDNMDSISTLSNNSAKDKKVIDDNGVVEYKLIAKTVSPSNATVQNDLKALDSYIANNKLNATHFAYYDLIIKRTEKDANGNVIDTDDVTDMVGESMGVSVSVPLGGHANDAGLNMVRIHNGSCDILPDTDGAGNSTYTFYSTKFSTYVLIHSVGTSTSENNTTAAPTNQSTQQPATSYGVTQYTTQFSTTTEHIPVPATAYDDSDDEDEDVKEIKDKTTKPKSSGSTSVGSLTSSGSAKTGDETPIVILFGMMLIAFSGIIVLRKKSKDMDA